MTSRHIFGGAPRGLVPRGGAQAAPMSPEEQAARQAKMAKNERFKMERPPNSIPPRPAGGLGGPSRRTWQQKALLAARAITELDPEYRGSFQAERDRMDGADQQRQQAAAFEQAIGQYSPEQQQALRAMPMEQAMSYLADRMLPSRADERADEGLRMQRTQMKVNDSRYSSEQDYRRERDGVNDEYRNTVYQDGRTDRAEDLEHRNQVFEHTVDQDEIGNAARRRQLDISEMSATASMDAAANEQASVAPHLQNLPNGVQSRIVGEEFDVLEAAGSRVEGARKGAQLAKKFMDESKGYNSLGGGVFNDLGQVFSNRTAGLKGITAEMIPMMRQAGEGIMTDADARRYEDAVVSINKPRGSNQNVSDSFAAAEQNAVANERFLRRFQAQNGYGSMGEGERLWAEYSDAHPIFDAETGQPNTDRIGIEQWFQGDQQHSPPVGPPEAAIQMLMQNPQLARSFDQKYGEGAADQYLGGQ